MSCATGAGAPPLAGPEGGLGYTARCFGLSSGQRLRKARQKMTPFSLADRRAFVTGANSGIGQAIAQALAAMGAAVTCAGRTEATQTVAAIRDAGGQAESLHLDLSNPMAAQDLFAGQDYTILVNNAGIILREDSMDYPEDMWDRVMDVNLKAVFFTSQAFARALPQAPDAASC